MAGYESLYVTKKKSTAFQRQYEKQEWKEMIEEEPEMAKMSSYTEIKKTAGCPRSF